MKRSLRALLLLVGLVGTFAYAAIPEGSSAGWPHAAVLSTKTGLRQLSRDSLNHRSQRIMKSAFFQADSNGQPYFLSPAFCGGGLVTDFGFCIARFDSGSAGFFIRFRGRCEVLDDDRYAAVRGVQGIGRVSKTLVGESADL